LNPVPEITLASYTYEDGKLVQVPDTVVAESCEISKRVDSTLIIRAGVHVDARARMNGTVVIEPGAVFEAHEPVGGTVEIRDGGLAIFRDRVGGTIHVHRGGRATLSASAVALGTMRVDGVLTNEGTRGTQVTGAGEVIDVPGAVVRQPDETWPDGTVAYRE
jgi:hypothetical protein